VSATELEVALRDIGVECTVDGRERLAVIVPTAEKSALFVDADRRRAMLALARTYGFTHLAVELVSGGTGVDAALSRD
jgi:hypothetical protein